MTTYMELVRGLPELRPMIAGRFEVLDATCYYPAIQMHIDEDEKVSIEDILQLPKKMATVFKVPGDLPQEMELYIDGEYHANFLEVLEDAGGSLDENAAV